MPSSDTDIAATDRLLHVADLHFWEIVRNPAQLMNKRFLGNLNVALRRRHQFQTTLAEAHLNHLAETRIAQALFTGDFTSTSTSREFVQAAAFVRGVADRGLDVFVVPGNHDVYTFGAARGRVFERYFEGLRPSEGYPALRRLRGGTSVVLVPTVRPNLLSSKGWISPADLERVRDLLQTAGDPVIVAAHYPVLHKTASYHTPPSRQLIHANTLREIVGTCGRRVLYVAGHVHRFSLTRDEQYPSVTHLTTGAFFHYNPKTGRQGEFSEIAVTPDGFRVWRHLLEETWRRTEATEGT